MTPHLFPSPAWTAAFAEAINENPEYREKGKAWTFGSVAMFLSPGPQEDASLAAGMVLDVDQGKCRAAHHREEQGALATALADEAIPFLISASLSDWRSVIEGKQDPIAAMMSGKLDLKKGHLPTMIRFVEASRALVKSATRVPTRFVGDA